MDGEKWKKKKKKKKKKGKSTRRVPGRPSPKVMMVMIYRAEVNPAGPELAKRRSGSSYYSPVRVG